MTMQQYTLHLGDCLEFMRGMDAGSVDAVITDPPYGISISDKELGKGRSTGIASSVMVYGVWDSNRVSKNHIDQIMRVSSNQVIWGGNYYSDMLPPSMGWLVWFKRDGLPTRSYADAELAWTSFDRAARVLSLRWDGFIRDTKEKRNGHPTEKPIELMRWCIELTTQPGDTVFDPFMGSGTTGVSCMQLGRNFIGCEIDQAYFAIAERRIRDAAAQPMLPGLTTEQPTHEQASLL